MTNKTSTNQSRTHDLMQSIRQHPVYRALIPLEAGVGWPAPLSQNKRVYLILPFFGMAPVASRNEIAVFAPFSSITLDWLTGTIVEYSDFRLRSGWQAGAAARPAGFFPHAAVEKLSTDEYLAKRVELCSRYDQLFDTMAQQGELPPFWLREFALLLDQLVEPALHAYYRAVSPKFYANFLSGVIS